MMKVMMRGMLVVVINTILVPVEILADLIVVVMLLINKVKNGVSFRKNIICFGRFATLMWLKTFHYIEHGDDDECDEYYDKMDEVLEEAGWL